MPSEEPLSLTDPEILGRTAAGDTAPFECLVERHEAAVLRFIRGICHDPDRAEDALQETFIAAWRAAGTFRGEGSVRSWLLTIARRAVNRISRRHAGEPTDFVSLQALGESAGWGEEPEEGAAKRLEDRDLVERGFAGLSPADREVLILHDLEGLTGEEVGRMLGLGLTAVKSRIHRARLRFLANLRREQHGRP